ncbi:hypothetical protein Tco_0408438 [Tanacetum coccineum]
MLVQPIEDEGEGSERPSEPQLIPSPPYLSADQHETQTNPSYRPSPTSHITDSILEGSGGNHGGTYHKAYEESKTCYHTPQSLDEKCIHEAKIGRKEILEEIVDANGVYPAFDELDDDAIDYMETEDAQDVGRTRYVVDEEKESAEKGSTDKQKVSTDKEEVSTDRPDEGDEGTVDQTEGRSVTPTTPTPTPTIFGDDETIAQVLLNMSQAKAVSREKEKGVHCYWFK